LNYPKVIAGYYPFFFISGGPGAPETPGFDVIGYSPQ
jgi:hypothetical protein